MRYKAARIKFQGEIIYYIRMVDNEPSQLGHLPQDVLDRYRMNGEHAVVEKSNGETLVDSQDAIVAAFLIEKDALPMHKYRWGNFIE
ncbi:MAG: hypothetical protein JWR44_1120 [Hymenobacter sp.]|jgi:hypothetical protein|nr:hypothetical protein [Hymenobacter sp.]